MEDYTTREKNNEKYAGWWEEEDIKSYPGNQHQYITFSTVCNVFHQCSKTHRSHTSAIQITGEGHA